MVREVTDQEMERRLAMAKAQSDITEAMAVHSLTALEWAWVLNECQRRLLSHGLVYDWSAEDE